MNQAFLMKVGWKLRTGPNDFWVQVVRAKYKCGNDVLLVIDKHPPITNLWKGVVKC